MTKKLTPLAVLKNEISEDFKDYFDRAITQQEYFGKLMKRIDDLKKYEEECYGEVYRDGTDERYVAEKSRVEYFDENWQQ